jgi:quinol monooxygenase YgiN
MYARSTTVRGNAEAMDDVVAYIRDEVMPALQDMSGCVGLSMLCDRDTGRCIVTSAWADETAMHATEQSVTDFRRRAAEMMGGEHDAQAWEIAVMHRMHDGHDGARARVLWGEMDPAHMDDAISTARMSLMSRLEELPGFCSASMMVDRGSGRTAATICYDSREDMERGADQAMSMREQLGATMGVRLTDMAEFDLVLHHLRVPETV